MTELSYRKLAVESIVSECESAKSFRLVAADAGTLYPHLPLRLKIPAQIRTVFRCYTISNYEYECYRLTIKREPPLVDKSTTDSGLSSGYFHDAQIGDILEARPPAENFWLDLQQSQPAVMLAGGIGVTPMMSMLEALDSVGFNRDVYFFFGLRHGADHVFRTRLRQFAERWANLRMHVFYERRHTQGSSDHELPTHWQDRHFGTA